MKVELISITENAEEIIEEAGRTAYLSFDKKTELPIFQIEDDTGSKKIVFSEELSNETPKKIGDKIKIDNKEWKIVRIWKNSADKFIKMLIRSGHHSVLEHAYATFRVKGGSRSFTHQLVRHRLAAFTQQSQRYVNEENFNYITPPSIKNNNEAYKIFTEFIKYSKETYRKLRELKIKKEDARFVLPNAVESEIVISANLREWRHIIELRGHPTAQWEIREFAIKVCEILKEKAPSVFYDFEIDYDKKFVLKVK